MVKAYVLIVTDPGSTRHVTATLAALPRIHSVSEVMGPYDIVAEIVAENLTEIPPILSNEIRSIEGIQSTTSLVAFPSDQPAVRLARPGARRRQAMAITLEAGDAAPEFALPDQDGATHRLADYRGQTVVLYFYPRDFTSGCTKQACSLRDANAEIAAEGAVILGVSTDDVDTHRRFREEHRLRFPLLSDEGAEVSTRYGSWGEKTLYGRKSIGMTRSTFIIGPDGKLVRLWKRARAADHGETVLKALRDLAGRS